MIVLVKPPDYAFTYTDSDTLPAELNEFFTYDHAEMDLVIAAKDVFDLEWKSFYLSMKGKGKQPLRSGRDVERWRDSPLERRKKFIARWIDALEGIDQARRVKALEILSYVVQGRSVLGSPGGTTDAPQTGMSC